MAAVVAPPSQQGTVPEKSEKEKDAANPAKVDPEILYMQESGFNIKVSVPGLDLIPIQVLNLYMAVF